MPPDRTREMKRSNLGVGREHLGDGVGGERAGGARAQRRDALQRARGLPGEHRGRPQLTSGGDAVVLGVRRP